MSREFAIGTSFNLRGEVPCPRSQRRKGGWGPGICTPAVSGAAAASAQGVRAEPAPCSAGHALAEEVRPGVTSARRWGPHASRADLFFRKTCGRSPRANKTVCFPGPDSEVQEATHTSRCRHGRPGNAAAAAAGSSLLSR